MINIVSTSESDAIAMSKNRTNSFFVLRAAPSAIFNGIDKVALLNWKVIPNNSSLGKDLVIPYTCFTRTILSDQAFNLLCGFIGKRFHKTTSYFLLFTFYFSHLIYY